ncbi:hypothetical protein UFOVP713_13 [uncultured Caudovirales phage]|uniref:Uncharacterized protein n=1 Tax=uncultured Caudovirales phage TaxID=2100421 RepID=A0A6J5NII0_9CAUD|nr:hypothetical protein UFOVP713_13 [uncultured Caudovirales phage]
MSLKLNSSGGGSVTLQEPTTASNRTLNLPDADASLVVDYSVITSAVSVTGATTLGSSAFGKLHQCSGTSADYTVTLPAVSGNAGKIIGFQMSTALTKLVTLDGNASETIDGATTRVMWAGETAILYCDGTAWTKIGGKTIPMIAGQTVSTTQSVATSTLVKKTLGTSTNSNCPASMNETGNSRIVIARGGNYMVQISSRLQNVSAQSSAESLLYKNGAEIAITDSFFGAGFFPNPAVTLARNFAVSDYLELYVRQYVGSNQTYGNFPENCLVATEIAQW